MDEPFFFFVDFIVEGSAHLKKEKKKKKQCFSLNLFERCFMTISIMLSLKLFISLFKLRRICTERAIVRLAEERVCGSCS